jgi:hypothetical protein
VSIAYTRARARDDIAVGDLRHEAQPQGALRVEIVAAQQRLLRPGQPDQLHQPRDPAVGGHHVEAALAEEQAGTGRRDPPVRRERQCEPGAGRRSVDGGDDRLLEAFHRIHELGEAVADVAVHARVVSPVRAIQGHHEDAVLELPPDLGRAAA